MRTTTEVFQDHLKRRLEGDVEGDIQANFAPNVVLLTGTGEYRGHEGVRNSASELAGYLGKDATFRYDHTLVVDGFAFLEWSANTEQGMVCDGADSFVIEDGKILFQSIHYTVQDTSKGNSKS